MFFLFINKETFYMKPISIVDDIKQIIVCDMKKNQIEKIMENRKNQTASDSTTVEFTENNEKFQMVLAKAQKRKLTYNNNQKADQSDLESENIINSDIETLTNELTRQNSANVNVKVNDDVLPDYRFIGIEINDDSNIKSHLFLVQHSRDNLNKLIEFINYHRIIQCNRFKNYK